MFQFQASPSGAMAPFAVPGDLVPILTTMAGVASPMCIPAGMIARGGLMAGHPVSALTGAPRGLTTDGATSVAGGAAHPVFNLSKLSAQIGVSEHGMLTVCTLEY